jgi:hypothetical protein
VFEEKTNRVPGPCSRKRRWLTGIALPGICLLLAATEAMASGQQSDFMLGFASHTPGASTSMTLHIVYRDPAHPDGKPSPIRQVVIDLPPGTSLNVKSVASCKANDQEIMALGPGACPPASRVGSGTLTAITGLGAPIDPFLTDVSVFNTGDGWVEVVQDHQTKGTVAADHFHLSGSTLTANPPSTPGGPPDGQTAVREIDFTFPASSGYITTPPNCPGAGAWTTRATFGFADASTQHVESTTPCSNSSVATSKQACANRIEGTKRRDRLNGTSSSDRIRGGRGSDRIKGRRGGDCLVGGRGRDRIRGGRGDDFIRGGAGRDRIRGGAGDDVVRARRGGHDMINCGPGRDTVYTGRIDRVRHCEVIKQGTPAGKQLGL